MDNTKVDDLDTMEVFPINVKDKKVDLDIDDQVSDIADGGSDKLPGFQWCDEFGSPTRQNWKDWKMAWSAFCIELVCKHVKELQHLLIHPRMDAKLKMPDGRIMTPDFHTISSEVRCYEFKAFKWVPTQASLISVQMECLKYLPYKITFIPIVTDEELPTLLSLKPNLAAFYRRKRQEYSDFVVANKDLLERYERKYREVYTATETILQACVFEKFPGVDTIPKFTKSMDDIARGALSRIRKIDTMLYKEKLPLEKLPESIFTYPPRKNIHAKHTLNRDKNREWAARITKKEPEDYGHKATQIFPSLILRSHMEREDLEVVHSDKPVVNKMIKLFNVALPLLDELRLIQQLKAMIQTDTKKEVLEDINKELGTKAYNRLDMIKEINGVCKGKVDKFTNDHSLQLSEIFDTWKIKKTGVFRLVNKDMQNYLHLGSGYSENPDKKIKRDRDSCRVTNGDFDTYFQMLKKMDDIQVPWKDISDNAFDFNQYLTHMLQEIKKIGSPILENLFNRRDIKVMYTIMKFMRDLVINVPMFNKKGKRTSDFKPFYSTELKCFVIASLSPNDMTTGVVKTVQLVDDESKEILINDNPFGVFTCTGSYKGLWLVESAWFRMNLSFVQEFDMIFGGYMCNQLLYKSQTGEFLDNSLFTFCYTNYSRQLGRVADLIYFALSRGTADLSFGKTDLSNKFKKIELKDPRVACLMNNFKSNWKQFYRAMEHVRNGDEYRTSPKTILDPFFLTNLRDHRDLLFLTYWKNCWPKMDGPDANKLLAGFFKDDLDQKKEWDECPFNPRNSPDVWQWGQDKFDDNLWKDGGWQSISYCPEVIQVVISHHYNEIKGFIKKDALSGVSSRLVTEGLKNSKVKVPTSWAISGGDNASKPEVDSGSEKAKSFTENANGLLRGEHEGLIGLDLPEVYTFLVTEFHRGAAEWEAELSKHWPTPIKVKRTTEPTQLEMALWLQWKYPKFAILTPELKDQTGADKRQFYEQTAHTQIPNRVQDMLFDSFLRASEYDMIRTPGDQKMPKIDEDIEAVKLSNVYSLLLFLNGDMKKWGDMFSLESLCVLNHSLFLVGYFTKALMDFSNACNLVMRNRVHLAPRATNKILIDNAKGEKRSSGHDSKTMEHIVESIGKVIAVDSLKLDATPRDFGDFTTVMTKNYGMAKDIGMALGVANSSTTLLAVGWQRLCKYILHMICPYIVTKGRVHSDDSMVEAALPRIRDSEWYDPNLDYGGILNAVNNGTHLVLDLDAMRIKETGKGGKSWDLRCLTKLYIQVQLYTSRYFGMRPSLGKFFVSPMGEVLQIAYDNKGNTEVPLCRYTAKMMATLPGKSYNTDLLSAQSRVLPLILHGGTTTLIHTIQVIVNNFMYWKFGLPIENMNYDHLPHIGGSYYAFPHDIIDKGFQSNLFRLMCKAQRDRTLEREMQMLLMTEEMWELRPTKRETARISGEGIDKVVSDVNEGLSKVTFEKEEYDGILGDTFLDTKIIWSTITKTLKTFSLQCELYKDIIQAELIKQNKTKISTYSKKKALEETDTVDKDMQIMGGRIRSDDIKLLNAKTSEYWLYGRPPWGVKVAKHLNKYTTALFQDSRFKKPLLIQKKNELGYANRIMSNPIRNYEKLGLPSKMTIQEFWATVRRLATTDFDIPLENKKMWLFLNKIYEDQVNIMLNSNVGCELQVIRSDEHVLNRRKEKYAIYQKMYNSVVFSYVDDVLGYFIEKHVRERKESEMVLFELKPWMRYDQRFRSEIQQLTRLLDIANIDPARIETNIEVLKRLLKPVGEKLVMRVASKDTMEALLVYRFDRIHRLAITRETMTFSNIVSRAAKAPISDQLYNGIMKAHSASIIYKLPNILNVNVRDREDFKCDSGSLQKWFKNLEYDKMKRAAEITISALALSGEHEYIDIAVAYANSLEDWLDFIYNDVVFEKLIKLKKGDEPLVYNIHTIIYCRLFQTSTLIIVDQFKKLILVTDGSNTQQFLMAVNLGLRAINYRTPKTFVEAIQVCDSSDYNLNPEGAIIRQDGYLAITRISAAELIDLRKDQGLWNAKSHWDIDYDQKLLKLGRQNTITLKGEEIQKPYFITPWSIEYQPVDIVAIGPDIVYERPRGNNTSKLQQEMVLNNAVEILNDWHRFNVHDPALLRNVLTWTKGVLLSDQNFGWAISLLNRYSATDIEVGKTEIIKYRSMKGEVEEMIQKTIRETIPSKEREELLYEVNEDPDMEFKRLCFWTIYCTRFSATTGFPIGCFPWTSVISKNPLDIFTRIKNKTDLNDLWMTLLSVIDDGDLGYEPPCTPFTADEFTKLSNEEFSVLTRSLFLTAGGDFKNDLPAKRSAATKLQSTLDNFKKTRNIKLLKVVYRHINHYLYQRDDNNFRYGYIKSVLDNILWDKDVYDWVLHIEGQFKIRSIGNGYMPSLFWDILMPNSGDDFYELIKS